MPPELITALVSLAIYLLAVGIAALIVGAVVNGGMTFFAVERHRARPMSLKAALGKGVDRFLSVLGAQVLVALILVGLVILPVALILAAFFTGNIAVAFLAIPIMIIVLGLVIYLSIVLSLAIPAVVMENSRAAESLGRSWRLAKGRFWSIFGAYIILGLLGAAVNLLITTPVAVLGNLYASVVATAVASGFVGSWAVIAAAVAYDLIVRYTPYAYQYVPPTWGTPQAPQPPGIPPSSPPTQGPGAK